MESFVTCLCVCPVCVSGMHVVLDVDGAAISCHHVHSGRQGQKKPWDDTADPTISLSPAVNSNLAETQDLHSSAFSQQEQAYNEIIFADVAGKTREQFVALIHL